MEQDISELVTAIGRRAREASRGLAVMGADKKRAVLEAVAVAIGNAAPSILSANREDLDEAAEKGLSGASLERLTLNEDRVQSIAEAVRKVAQLPDPVGEVISEWERPNGLIITKKRTPIGVVGIIFESRPNVTIDAAVLCIKTGNAVILRGGSEALRSNLALAAALNEGGLAAGLPPDAVQLIPVADRAAVREMARMDKYIDVIVPRGGHALISTVVEHARMPVIKHFHGICSVYVDAAADPEMAARIAINSKCQRPGVCNAMETLLVHAGIAPQFFDAVMDGFSEVEIHADAAALALLSERGHPSLLAATESDWTTEFLDLKLAVKVVKSLDEAISHINTFGSHHSDAIVTKDTAAADKFLAEVDSAAVYWNASTRFTDGGEFGFGAEIGISTDKLHARGPMGLEELTTYKYLVRGNGQIRE